MKVKKKKLKSINLEDLKRSCNYCGDTFVTFGKRKRFCCTYHGILYKKEKKLIKLTRGKNVYKI
jgi:hypothetical protein